MDFLLLYKKDVNMEKILSFDLEIVKEIPEGIKDWREIRPLGISCVALLPNNEPLSYLYFHHNEKFQPINGEMTKDELSFLISSFMELINNGYKILTWNGLQFDFDVRLIGLNGFYTEIEPVGYCACAKPPPDQAEHFKFAVAEQTGGIPAPTFQQTLHHLVRSGFT